MLSVAELAKRYDVAVQTVYHWNHFGRGPQFIKVGRLPRYRLADVLAWEKQRTRNGTAAS